MESTELAYEIGSPESDTFVANTGDVALEVLEDLSANEPIVQLPEDTAGVEVSSNEANVD